MQVHGGIRCECCKTFTAAIRPEWDWFTGYLSRTHHYCPAHKNSKERDVMFSHSRRGVRMTPKEPA